MINRKPTEQEIKEAEAKALEARDKALQIAMDKNFKVESRLARAGTNPTDLAEIVSSFFDAGFDAGLKTAESVMDMCVTIEDKEKAQHAKTN